MAHQEQTDFFSSIIDSFQSHFKGKVIDIGSLDINGGPHDLFEADEYVGVDLAPGKNVTFVSGGQDVDLKSNNFDVVMSSECLEHNAFFKETLAQMARLARPGGLIVWSCAGLGRLEHGTTRSSSPENAPFVVDSGFEYYRNVTKRMALDAINHDAWFISWRYWYNEKTRDTYFIGLKKPQLEVSVEQEMKNLQDLITKFDLRYGKRRWKLRYILEFFRVDEFYFYREAGVIFWYRKLPERIKKSNPTLWTFLKQVKKLVRQS